MIIFPKELCFCSGKILFKCLVYKHLSNFGFHFSIWQMPYTAVHHFTAWISSHLCSEKLPSSEFLPVWGFSFFSRKLLLTSFQIMIFFLILGSLPAYENFLHKTASLLLVFEGFPTHSYYPHSHCQLATWRGTNCSRKGELPAAIWCHSLYTQKWSQHISGDTKDVLVFGQIPEYPQHYSDVSFCNCQNWHHCVDSNITRALAHPPTKIQCVSLTLGSIFSQTGLHPGAAMGCW